MLSDAIRRRASFAFSLTLAACLLEPDYEPRYPQANLEYPVPSGAVELDAWSSALAAARCSFLERCNDADLQGRFYRSEPCLDYFRAFYDDAIDLPGLVQEGHVGWDAAAFASCVDDMARMNCEDYSQPRPCYEEHGTLAEGDACGHDAECGANLFCKYQDTCGGGRCQHTLPEGADCQHGEQCRKGLECFDIVERDNHRWGTCRALLTRGAECDEGESLCGPGLRCELREGYDQTGDCKPRKPGWNAPPQADRDALCDDSYTVCLNETECRPVNVYDAGVAYAPPRCVDALALGERCLRADLVVLSACVQGSYCEASDDLEFGACVPRIERDAACTGVDPHQCLEGLICDPSSFTCVPKRRALRGEPCQTYVDCYSEDCRDDVCVAAFCP